MLMMLPSCRGLGVGEVRGTFKRNSCTCGKGLRFRVATRDTPVSHGKARDARPKTRIEYANYHGILGFPLGSRGQSQLRGVVSPEQPRPGD